MSCLLFFNFHLDGLIDRNHLPGIDVCSGVIAFEKNKTVISTNDWMKTINGFNNYWSFCHDPPSYADLFGSLNKVEHAP